MRSPTLLLLLLAVTFACTFAQPAKVSVSGTSGNVSFAFHADPRHGDARQLPLIACTPVSGNKESFGIFLGGVPAGTKIFELLDMEGKVLRSVSVNEFLAGKASLAGRRAETVCSLPAGKGNVQVIMKALATGEAKSTQQLIVTFALKSDIRTTLGLKVLLPFLGRVDAVGKGLLFGTKRWSSAVVAAVHPSSATFTATNTTVSLVSPRVELDGASESAALWLVMDGLKATSAADARTEGMAMQKSERPGQSGASLVIVSSADKQNTRPGDVVAYTIVCQNIGTSDATDAALSNPIPPGMEYLEGSATEDGATVTFERSGAGATATVRTITWKLRDPLKAGEERKVSFKARVR